MTSENPSENPMLHRLANPNEVRLFTAIKFTTELLPGFKLTWSWVKVNLNEQTTKKFTIMAKITTAWVWVYPHASQFKSMTFDEVRRFCKEHGYQISKNGQLFDVDEYTFSADVEPLRQYCFVVGHYECPPHIDLVPCGTMIADGRYVFPKENKQ